MLVIGFNSANNYHFSHKLDVDLDLDSPKKIHDLLKKEAGKEMKGTGFTLIVCVDDEGYESVSFEDSEDYDISSKEEDDDEMDDDADPDHLHEDEESDDDDEE